MQDLADSGIAVPLGSILKILNTYLPVPSLAILEVYSAMAAFMSHKLNSFAKALDIVDYYQMLALFSLPSVFIQPMSNEEQIGIQLKGAYKAGYHSVSLTYA